MTTTSARISSSEIPSKASSEPVVTLIPRAASTQIRAHATSEIGSHGGESAIPALSISACPKTPMPSSETGGKTM